MSFEFYVAIGRNTKKTRQKQRQSKEPSRDTEGRKVIQNEEI